MKLFLYLLFGVVLLIAIAIVSGAHNISATEKHWDITEKTIGWIRDSLIEVHAKNLAVPQLDDRVVLSNGFKHYHAMCTECHLAPGFKATEISMGLYPQPPVFHERTPVTEQTIRSDTIRKYFWVIKNGLKMTGMPAWGLSHDDQSIWSMAAFVVKLHGMSAAEYESLVRTIEVDHSHDRGHDDHTH